jgi:hypothetical protein
MVSPDPKSEIALAAVGVGPVIVWPFKMNVTLLGLIVKQSFPGDPVTLASSRYVPGAVICGTPGTSQLVRLLTVAEAGEAGIARPTAAKLASTANSGPRRVNL